MTDEKERETRSWLAEALARRVRHPSLEQTLFHQLEELQHGPLERLAELVHLVADELRAAEHRLSEQAADLRALQRTVAELAGRVGRLESSTPAPAAAGHVLLLSTARGYRLLERPGPPPAPGDEVAVEGARFRILRAGGSPLPGDRRPCALCLPD